MPIIAVYGNAACLTPGGRLRSAKTTHRGKKGLFLAKVEVYSLRGPTFLFSVLSRLRIHALTFPRLHKSLWLVRVLRGGGLHAIFMLD